MAERLRTAWAVLPRWARWVLAVYLIGFADGTGAHVRDLIGGGIHAYSGVPHAWIQVLFISLVVLDPLVVVLAGFVLRAGVLLAAVVMVLDAAGNWIADWPSLRAHPAWLVRPEGVGIIVPFGVFVLATALPLLRVIRRRVVGVEDRDLLRYRDAVTVSRPPGLRAMMGAWTGTPMDDPYRLERFVAAQDAGGTYQRALAELRAGAKRGHWMWFVFPQIAGLGFSAMSRRYAIGSLAEARAYLAHEVLGPRLAECTRILAATEGKPAAAIFGDVDAMKLRSSMTLFMTAAPDDPVFSEVLGKYFGGKPDAATLERLALPAAA